MQGDPTVPISPRSHPFILLASILSLVGLLAPAVAPLSAAKAESKFDPQADFSTYQTYAWRLQEVRFPPADTPADLEIIEAVNQRLGREGLHEVRGEGATPDFYVTYYAVVEDKLEIQGSEYELGSWVTWSDTGGTQVRSYKEGTLVIDIVDAESNKLVWSGWISDIAVDVQAMRRKVPKAVRRILEQFPPDPE